MRRSYVMLSLVSILMASCDPARGIDATARLAGVPDLSCIPRVLESAEGVKAVKYQRTETPASQYEIERGALPVTVIETWTYSVGSLSPRVRVFNAIDGYVFSNGIGLAVMNVSNAQLAEYRTLIENMNDLLMRECNLGLRGIIITEYPEKL